MDSKSPERYKAFRILDPLQGQEGPGLVFTEFVPNVFDQSLLTATYPFNALRNRDLDPGKTRWAGVLADVSFRDYFARRFPRSQCYPLYPDLPALEGQLDLFWVPINGPDRAVFGEWAKIHGRIADLFTLLPYHLARPDYGPARDLLEKTLPECGSDAFLELSILDKMRGLGPDSPENFEAKTRLIRQAIQRCGASPDLRTKKGYLWEDLGQVYWNCAHDERAMAAALTQALATGHESAWIYRRLGEWELKNKDYGKALWAFQQYLRLDTANPPPAPLLQWLHERAKPQRILAP
jgi:hypothetical protein